jgi:hypothetical protein
MERAKAQQAFLSLRPNSLRHWVRQSTLRQAPPAIKPRVG